MDRREFCLNAFLTTAALSAPRICGAYGDIGGHIILVELTGANDGLNTVVPFKNDRYYSLRPEIGIPKKDVLSLDNDQGLHPSLVGIRSLYESGDLRIFQNVGYPEQIQSHFRSIEIWERGGDGRANGREGWLVKQLARLGVDRFDAPGIYLGGTGNIFAGGKHYLGPHSIGKILSSRDQGTSIDKSGVSIRNPLLASIQQSQKNHNRRATSIASKLQADKTMFRVRGRQLGGQLRTVCDLISANVQIPVFKVTLGSFDTHVNQRNQHRNLLRELDEALTDTVAALKRIGVWDRVSIITYSEFGRRVAENGARGTDHGTAAPHFYLSGNVRGGIHGGMADLEKLKKGDLIFKTDYRSVFEFALRHHLGIDRNIFSEFRSIES